MLTALERPRNLDIQRLTLTVVVVWFVAVLALVILNFLNP
jgi:preprotein translocase subunit SecG